VGEMECLFASLWGGKHGTPAQNYCRSWQGILQKSAFRRIQSLLEGNVQLGGRVQGIKLEQVELLQCSLWYRENVAFAAVCGICRRRAMLWHTKCTSSSRDTSLRNAAMQGEVQRFLME
jgi:hypothetical protein